jgi:hypothetical protein
MTSPAAARAAAHVTMASADWAVRRRQAVPACIPSMRLGGLWPGVQWLVPVTAAIVEQQQRA